MAKYGSNALSLTIGGTEIKAYLRENVELEVEGASEDSTAFGDTWFKELTATLKRGLPFTVRGMYDDTAATGPDAKLGVATIGTEVAVVITWGGAKTSTFQALIKKYKRLASIGKLTAFESTLIPTGTVGEA